MVLLPIEHSLNIFEGKTITVSHLFLMTRRHLTRRPVPSQDSRRERSLTGHTLLFFSSPRAWALPEQLTHPAALGNRKPVSSFGLSPALYYQVDPCKCISPMEEEKPPRDQGTGEGVCAWQGKDLAQPPVLEGWLWDEASRGGYGRAEPMSVHG